MTISLLSIVCLICLSFFFGLFTCLYLFSQISKNDDVKYEFEPEIKIGYKRNTIKNNK